MSHLIILSSQSGDWEAAYLNGERVEQHHELFEGNRYEYVKFLIKNGINQDDIIHLEAGDKDDEFASNYGCFPLKFDQLMDDYSKQTDKKLF